MDLGKGVHLQGNSIIYKKEVPGGQVKVKRKIKRRSPVDLNIAQHILGTDIEIGKQLFSPESPLTITANKEFNIGSAKGRLSGSMGEGKLPDKIMFDIVLPFPRKKGGKI